MAEHIDDKCGRSKKSTRTSFPPFIESIYSRVKGGGRRTGLGACNGLTGSRLMTDATMKQVCRHK